jgi:hypothetical protein
MASMIAIPAMINSNIFACFVLSKFSSVVMRIELSIVSLLFLVVLFMIAFLFLS